MDQNIDVVTDEERGITEAANDLPLAEPLSGR